MKKKMAKYIIKASVFFAIFFFLNISCKKSPTEPSDNLKSGRRDYTWTIDTLNMPINNVLAIWGAEPNDVWAVGFMGTAFDRLLHYDGSKWNTYNKEPILCEGETLIGFSKNDVWMGGRDGLGAGLWHYDGNTWSMNFTYKVADAYDMRITDIWGTSSNDLYACGCIGYYNSGKSWWNGFVLHYDGTKWNEVTRTNFNSQFINIRTEQNKIFIFSFVVTENTSDTIAFYTINNSHLEKIYANSVNNIVFGNMHSIAGKLYFLIGQDVFRYINGSFAKQFSFNDENFGYQFYGRNEKDIFLRMRNGLAHYNGTDIKYLYNFPLNKISIKGEPLLFNSEVFFCLWDKNGSDIMSEVLHGKLE
jgi:hypothetical protein